MPDRRTKPSVATRGAGETISLSPPRGNTGLAIRRTLVAVKFDLSDLEFILAQIQMAEAGQPPDSAHLAFGLREVAGTNNNSIPGNGLFGAANQNFPAMTDPLLQTVSFNADGTIFDPIPSSPATSSRRPTSRRPVLCTTLPRAPSAI